MLLTGAYDADVFIAGAGAVGILAAFRLEAKGYRCLLVEPRAVAAGQSGHSHGYVHKGYIYLRSETELVKQFRQATEEWTPYLRLAEDCRLGPDSSIVAFRNLEVARYAADAWENAGLPVFPLKKRSWPKTLKESRLRAAYRTEEATLDFARVLGQVAAHKLRTCEFILGAVSRLELRDRQCVGIVVRIGATFQIIRTRYVILAAGTGNSDILLNTLGSFRCAPSTRTSYMLVMRGRSLSPLRMILPEDEFYGLFLVSRQTSDAYVWLVSNYLSYAGLCSTDDLAARTWVVATLRTLDRVLPASRDRKLQWGIYAAPKAEFRRDPEKLPQGRVIEDFGLRNVVAAWPTKLTLAPLTVDAIVDGIVRTLGGPTNRLATAEHRFTVRNLPVSGERWTTVRLVTRKHFGETYAGIGAAGRQVK